MSKKERPTFRDFSDTREICLLVLNQFMNKGCGGRKLLRAELNFSKSIKPFVFEFGEDAESFAAELAIVGGEKYADYHKVHELEYMQQVKMLAEKYGIPLRGRLAIVYLATDSGAPDEVVIQPLVLTNLADFLTVTDDEIIRAIYRELAEGVSDLTDGDVLFQRAVSSERSDYTQEY